ncbi:MAG: flavodoxin family protein [Candidatus Latescibacterota bacterium]
MRRVLGVVGSPRRGGNTHLLVEHVLEGARQAGAQTGVLLLADLIVRDCDGCHACWRGKPCSKRDDMAELYPRIAAADALVFGTPVYWYGPTALMKAFLDRFVYFNCPEHRPAVRGKAAALAVPFEEDGPQTAELVVEMFARSLRYLEMRLVGQVLAPGVGEMGEVLHRPDVLQHGVDLGRHLARGM